MSKSLYELSVKNIKGQEVSLGSYKDKVLLIVNVASKCGYTHQYKGLEALYEKYQSRGFEVLGFPCNQFGSQEPGNEAEIEQFCTLTFNVKFPMFAKVDVNGKDAHPLYQFLKKEAPGILGTEAIKWNFTKFLINKEGKVIKRFAPNDEPESLTKEIEALLN